MKAEGNKKIQTKTLTQITTLLLHGISDGYWANCVGPNVDNMANMYWLNMQLEIKPNKVLVYTWYGMRSNRENENGMCQLGGVFSYVVVHITPPSHKMNSKGKRALRKLSAITGYLGKCHH